MMDAMASLPTSLRGRLDCLLIDNFDSFTWNLYQRLCLLGANVAVIRNDAIPATLISQLEINRLVISPGPGHPKTDSGISRDAIAHFAGKVPVLGVCMGLQCIVDYYGGHIDYAGEIKHGKLSAIRHDARGCFTGLPQSFKSTRYHSLSASLPTIPDELMITAVTEDSGVIMGVRHRNFTIEAVQYHPESVLSEAGDQLLRNFLALRGGTWDLNPQSLILDQSLPPFPFEALGTKLASDPKSSQIPTILEKICAQRLKDVELAKSTPGTTPTDLNTFISLNLAPPLIHLVSRLRSARSSPALMAEFKRASPSKGPIALSANAPQQALIYALSGAAVISVLTEPTWFKGSLLDMRLARQAVDSLSDRPAILRKDFILEEYQIAEARLHGADTVLLIVAMLPHARLQALYAYSLSLGMEPLVEVNNAREMEQALHLGAKVIGVNNRNLHNFEVDMNTTTRLVDMVRDQNVLLCALSGISASHDVESYAAQGIHAVLVGEALMRAPDPPAFTRALLGWPEPVGAVREISPLVKICGIRTEQDALFAAKAGADMLGVMFVPTSKRYVSLETACLISAAVRSLRFADQFSESQPNLGSSSLEENERTWFARQARWLRWTPSRPLLVGVFQDQPLHVVLYTAAACQLDMIQLHGNEPLEWAHRIPLPVIRVAHVDGSGQWFKDVNRPCHHEFILLDTAIQGNAGLSGGAGATFDWELARRVVDTGEIPIGPAASDAENPEAKNVDRGSLSGGPLSIFLAGGLTPENVAQAVTQVRPFAVDVSSGVESVDGQSKDPAKVSAFIQNAKRSSVVA